MKDLLIRNKRRNYYNYYSYIQINDMDCVLFEYNACDGEGSNGDGDGTAVSALLLLFSPLCVAIDFSKGNALHELTYQMLS